MSLYPNIRQFLFGFCSLATSTSPLPPQMANEEQVKNPWNPIICVICDSDGERNERDERDERNERNERDNRDA